MAVVVNNTDTRVPSPNVTASFSFTSSSGSNRLITVQETCGDDRLASSVSYGGQTLTGPSGSIQDNANDRGKLRIWRKTGQLTGANTVSVTQSAYGSSYISVADFTGVDQTTPIGTLVELYGVSAAPALSSITCPTNGVIWGGMWANYGTSAPTIGGSGNTLAGAVRGGSSGVCVASAYRSTTGVLQWALPGSTSFTAQAIPINAATASGPTINTQPTNQTVTTPATATFTVSATASSGSLTYQWQRNGSDISGATSASYTTPATTVSGGSANNGDAYLCNVTDSNGTTATSAATLTVNTAASKSGVNFFYRKGNGNV